MDPERTPEDEGEWCDRSLSVTQLNVWGMLPALALLAGPLVAYDLVHGGTPIPHVGLLVLGTMLGFVVHEALHGLAFRAGGAPWRTISFGFIWKYGAFYAHTTTPITARAYRRVLVLPGLVLGLLPAVAAVALESALGTWLAAVMLMGAVGDLLLLWMARDLQPGQLVVDHRERPGFLYRQP